MLEEKGEEVGPEKVESEKKGVGRESVLRGNSERRIELENWIRENYRDFSMSQD